MSEHSDVLIDRMNTLEADAYTERDGGDWYVVAGGGEGRLAEGFRSRDDARRCILWLCGDPIRKGWHFVRIVPLFVEISLNRDDHGSEYATVWRGDAARYLDRRRLRGKPAGVLP